MYSMMLNLSRLMAYLGGLMLVALIVLTCVSVLGRSLNGFLHGDFMEAYAPAFSTWALGIGVGPVNGDFELVEAGVAFAIFAFLPLCHMTGGHATVDVFTSHMSDRTNRFLQMVAAFLFAAVLVLIAVQLFAGLQSKMRSGQTTFLIEFPIWWAYAASLIGAILAAVVAVYLAAVRSLELIQGRAILPDDAGAEH